MSATATDWREERRRLRAENAKLRRLLGRLYHGAIPGRSMFHAELPDDDPTSKEIRAQYRVMERAFKDARAALEAKP